MIPKKIMLKQKIERDDDSKKIIPLYVVEILSANL